MDILKASRIIRDSELFKVDTDVYIKNTDYIIDLLIDKTYKYYNILLIELGEDEMRVYSPTFYDENLKSFKYSDMEDFILISSIF